MLTVDVPTATVATKKKGKEASKPSCSWTALRGVAQLTKPTAHCDYDQIWQRLQNSTPLLPSPQLQELQSQQHGYRLTPCVQAMKRNFTFIQARGHWIRRIILPSLQPYRVCTETIYLACYYYDRYCLQRIIPSAEWADLVALTAAFLAMKVSEEVDPEVDKMLNGCREHLQRKIGKATILALERRMVDLFHWQLNPPTTHGMVYACLDSLGLEGIPGIASWKQWVACLADRILNQHFQEHSCISSSGALLLAPAIYAALKTVLSDRVIVHAGWQQRLAQLFSFTEEDPHLIATMQSLDALDLRLSGPRRPFHSNPRVSR